MEADGALALFKRSQSKFGLTYKTHIGDGDSKSYSTVAKAIPYGPLVHIRKEECVAYITKRMGPGLHEIVKRSKGTIYYYYWHKRFSQIVCKRIAQRVAQG